MRGIRIEQRLTTDASLQSLLDVIARPDGYVASEPRLVSARWLDSGAPQVGAQGEVVTDMPFTVPLVRRLIRNPRGIVTVTEWSPPRRCACRFEGSGLEGAVTLDMLDEGARRRIDVNGVIAPTSGLAGMLLRPLHPQLERLAARSVRRGMGRLERYLAESTKSI